MNYILTFIEGFLAFISPCILPMLPVYFIYLAGAAGDGTRISAKNRLLLNSVGFVIGFAVVFILLGATVTLLGQFLSGHRDVLRKISAVVMIIFGLNFTGILEFGFLNSEKRFQYGFEKLRFTGSILFGMVFGFSWTPCLGAFLGSALALAGSSRTVLDGMLLLLLFSSGLGIPFVITALIFEKLETAFGFLKKHSRIIGIVSGFLLILAGVMVFFDRLKYLSF